MLKFGTQGLYEWLVTDQQVDLLQMCPDIVMGKYVAITSIDSGALPLTEQQRNTGWESRNQIAYSSKVQDLKDLPRDGYDEWYVFANPFDLGRSHLQENVFKAPQEAGHVNVFVNYGCFAFDSADTKDLSDLLWHQIERIRPESYLADGDFLNFATANKALFGIIRDSLCSFEKA